MKTVIDLFPLMFSEAGAPVSNDWIQIMKTGKFKYNGQDIEITDADLQQFAENFRNKVRGVDLAVDVSHKPEDGSVGWFEDMRAENGRLMAKIRWTDEGRQLVESGKFRYFSPEWSRQWTDTESGKTFRNVMFGGALTNRPFLKGMEPVGVAMSEDGASMITFWTDGSDDNSGSYDPDGDGDDDSTTDPDKNPDWIDDVKMGATPFDVASGRQQQMLARRGITKEKADGARAQFLKNHPEHSGQKFEDRSTATSQKGNESRVSMTESEFRDVMLSIFSMGEDITNAHKSPPEGKPKDASQYADPKNFKYPVDSKHIQAAIDYYNQDGMQTKGGYSDSQWSSIGRKIVEAANKELGEGYSIKDGKVVTPSQKDSGSKSMEDDNGDGSGSNDGTQNLNPDDGSSTPEPINDEETGKFSETHKSTGGGVEMDTVSIEQYQAVVNRVNVLEAELNRNKMSEKVDGFIRAGKLVPAARDSSIEMLIGMSEDQVAKWSEVIEKSPQVVTFTETGFSGDAGETDGDKLMSELTAQKKAEGKSIRIAMTEAYQEVTRRGLKVSGYGE